MKDIVVPRSLRLDEDMGYIYDCLVRASRNSPFKKHRVLSKEFAAHVRALITGEIRLRSAVIRRVGRKYREASTWLRSIGGDRNDVDLWLTTKEDKALGRLAKKIQRTRRVTLRAIFLQAFVDMKFFSRVNYKGKYWDDSTYLQLEKSA